MNTNTNKNKNVEEYRFAAVSEQDIVASIFDLMALPYRALLALLTAVDLDSDNPGSICYQGFTIYSLGDGRYLACDAEGYHIFHLVIEGQDIHCLAIPPQERSSQYRDVLLETLATQANIYRNLNMHP